MTLTPDQIKHLHHRLQLDPSQFARLFAVEASTIRRWESGAQKPTGVAATILTALWALLDLNQRLQPCKKNTLLWRS